MEGRIEYIKCLVYFGYIDNELHELEKEFVRKVGRRFGLEQALIDEELKLERSAIEPSFPSSEIMRFMLLDDLLNLMAVDGKIKTEEINYCKEIAEKFGFESSLMDSLAQKLQQHIRSGCMCNHTSSLIKNELFRITLKNFTNERYNF